MLQRYPPVDLGCFARGCAWNRENFHLYPKRDEWKRFVPRDQLFKLAWQRSIQRFDFCLPDMLSFAFQGSHFWELEWPQTPSSLFSFTRNHCELLFKYPSLRSGMQALDKIKHRLKYQSKVERGVELPQDWEGSGVAWESSESNQSVPIIWSYTFICLYTLDICSIHSHQISFT